MGVGAAVAGTGRVEVGGRGVGDAGAVTVAEGVAAQAAQRVRRTRRERRVRVDMVGEFKKPGARNGRVLDVRVGVSKEGLSDLTPRPPSLNGKGVPWWSGCADRQ